MTDDLPTYVASATALAVALTAYASARRAERHALKLRGHRRERRPRAAAHVAQRPLSVDDQAHDVDERAPEDPEANGRGADLG